MLCNFVKTFASVGSQGNRFNGKRAAAVNDGSGSTGTNERNFGQF
jgi:hypothetical protein